MTHVKICGITNVNDALCAATAGADMLGYIFYPPSARYVTPGQAGQITRAVRHKLGAGAPRMVGVFVDVPADQIAQTAATAGLDLIQLHGAGSPEVVRLQGLPAFTAIRSRTPDEARDALSRFRECFTDRSDVPDLLIDAYHPKDHGGTGLPADADAAQWLAQRCRLLLAGGLTPDNVSDAMTLIRPWGVDVSSGVESAKGKKNHALVRAFVAAVHITDQRNSSQSTLENS